MPKTNEKPRRSTGMKQEGDKGFGYLPNGKPNLSPEAGYVNTEPVQYSDETDVQFTRRHADWEIRFEHAKDIAAGGASLESQMKVLDAQYELDKASLEAQHKDDNK